MRRTKGRPTSSNRASSLHLRWVWDGKEPDLVAVEATLTVLDPTPTDDLRFWALQASFVSSAGGRRFGGAHLGLQRHRDHPAASAANWGGYRPEGGELTGPGPNTRPYPWDVGRPYRLRIAAPTWTGEIDGRPLRSLDVDPASDRVGGIVVWSEVFADCGDPPHRVRWSDLAGTTSDGATVRPRAVVVNYQSWADGGCTNTDSSPDDGGYVQTTGTKRRTPQGAVLSPTPAR